MKEMTMKMKRDYARMLFLKDNLMQKEIAERVGASEQTICKWKQDDNWENLKANFVISRQETLSRTYAQINQIFAQLEAPDEAGIGNRSISSKEADTLSKLAAAAKCLESDLSISTYIDVFIKFGNWLRDVDFAVAQKLTEYQDTFIKEQLRNA